MIHIANTFLEWELTHNPSIHTPLSQAFNRNPIILQLQFLPLLYAGKDDALLVSHLPPIPTDQMKLYTSLSHHPHHVSNVDAWGASQIIMQLAKQHNLVYTIPNWDVVQKVNSKAFSWDISPKLPHATILQNKEEAIQWFAKPIKKRVLKTCFGVSGGGHLLCTTLDVRVQRFLQKEWQQKRGVIGEPWMERHLDFSSQWIISKDQQITFIGSTLCTNTPQGQYQSTHAGDETILFGANLPFLIQHKQIAYTALTHMAHMGYFGHVGIDAMIYIDHDDQSLKLHPIVEINARKTMGWVAITFQKTHHPHRLIQLSYLPSQQGLLPTTLQLQNGQHHHFAYNLTCTLR